MNRRLYKSTTDHMISGVAGGVAEYLDADPSIVRGIWALLAIITGGVFLAVYVVMWIVVPSPPKGSAAPAAGDSSAPEEPSPSGSSSSNAQPVRPPRRSSGGGSWLFGLLLVGVGLYFLAREYLTWFDVDRLWPLALVAVGVVLILFATRRRPA